MASLSDFYDVTFMPMAHVTPRASRLSCHEDYDGHTHEKCIVVHLPSGILKLYPKPKEPKEKK